MIPVEGVEFVADLSGAIYWPAEGLLVAVDLHLEKGSAYAARGVLLPPYNTASTLERLAWVIAFYDPRIVVALGDSFHDGRGAARLGEEDRAALLSMQHGRDWVWVAGNHDPDPARAVGGSLRNPSRSGTCISGMRRPRRDARAKSPGICILRPG